METYKNYTISYLKEDFQNQNFFYKENQIEIPSCIKTLRKLETGFCLICNRIGSSIVETVYLCEQCQLYFQEVVRQSFTVFCETGNCPEPIFCSFCLAEKIYKNVPNALSRLVPDFKQKDFSFDITEDVPQSSTLDLTFIDRTILNHLNVCLIDFIRWIFEQGDISRLNSFECVDLLMSRIEKCRFVFFALTMYGLHGVVKVQNGYIRIEDVRYMPFRKIIYLATTLDLSPFNKKNIYLLKWLTLFQPDNLKTDFDLSRDEKEISCPLGVKIMLHNNWKLLEKIDKDGLLISTAKEVLNVAAKASEILVELEQCLGDTEEKIRQWVRRRLHDLPMKPEIADTHLLPSKLCNIFNEILFDSYEQAKHLLSNFFSEPDTTNILRINFPKFYALKCAQDAKLLQINEADRWYPLFEALRALNRNFTILGFDHIRPINYVYLAMLTDPEEELSEMLGMTIIILSQIFFLSMCKMLNTNLPTLKLELPRGGIKHFIRSAVPLSYLPISRFLIRIMSVTEELQNDNPLLINPKFWLKD